ncbi:MAG: carbohydrate binding domain-containing protein [Planctomycetota bacterium]
MIGNGSRIGLGVPPAALVLAALTTGARGADVAKLRERADAIAKTLPARPEGVGRPVTDRDAWRRLAGHPAYAGVVKRAEGYLKEKLPPISDDLYLDFSKTGNRTRWQGAAGRRYGRLPWLVIAECIEDRGRFVGPFEEVVRALAADRTWVMPAHDRSLANFHGKSIDIDLRSAAMGWTLATAHWLLGDRLPEETRGLILDECRRRVLVPFRDMVEGRRRRNWWMNTTNNWNAVCLAGVTGTALALIDDRTERALYVAAAEHYSRNFLRGFAMDGYCTEGVGYWNYGFGNYVNLAEAIQQATRGGVALMDRKDARLPAEFGARIEIANGVYPAFADCGVGSRPSSRLMWYVSRRLGLGLGRWETYDPISSGGHPFEAMLFSFPNSASEAPVIEQGREEEEEKEGLGERTWFDEAGILIGRPGRARQRPTSVRRDAPGDLPRCRLAVALKGGHNAEHHNHNDVGSYVAVVGSEAVLLDAGGEVYTSRTFSSNRYVSKILNSWGHPVPVVAGELQRTGRDARGRVLRTEFTRRTDTLALDTSSAYRVKGLRRLVRTFVYSREGEGSLLVTDEAEFDSAAEFGTALVTLGRFERLDDGALLIYGLNEAVRVEVDTGGLEFTVEAKEIDEDVRTPSPPARIGIDLAEPAERVKLTLLIEPADLPDTGGGLVRNGGFELGSWGWSVARDGMSSISTEQASSGTHSLKVADARKDAGSSVTSASAPVERGGEFEIRGKVFPASGDGLGVYVRSLDADGRRLEETLDERGWERATLSLGGSEKRWKPFAKRFTVPERTRALQVWIHSYTGAQVEAYLDDIELVRVDE